MMFVKITFRNIKNRIHDYLIYLLTLTVLAAMLLAAFMLPVFLDFSINDSGVFMTNSMPALLMLTLFFLMFYMNRFMLKRRSQEFAIYTLSGVSKNKISLLYFGEHMLLGLFALFIGLFLGLLIFLIILSIFSAVWNFQDIIFAALKTCVCFIITHSVSLILTVLYIRRLNIKNLLNFRKDNEQYKANMPRLISLSIASFIAFLVYCYQITHFSLLTSSTIAFNIGIILYGFYASIFGWLAWYRKQHGCLLYHDKCLFIIGQLMSKAKTLVRMSTIISGCLLIAMVSFVNGWIFTFNNGALIGVQEDIVMGFAQFYIAVLFTLIVFSIIALQQIVDIREHKQKYIILKQLGTNLENLNQTLFKQVFLNFTIPVLMAVMLMFFSLYPLEQLLNSVLNKNHLLVQGIFVYMCIFIILYLSYMAVTYMSLRKIKYLSRV